METIRLLEFAPEGFLVAGLNVEGARDALDRALADSGAMVHLDFTGITVTREAVTVLLTPAAERGSDACCRLVLAGCDPEARTTVTEELSRLRRGR